MITDTAKWIATVALITPLIACSRGDGPPTEIQISQNIDKREISPIPKLPEHLPQTVYLGARLFHDPRLSKTMDVSCANCHQLAQGGDDGQKTSTGINGALGKINAPTVLNSRFNFRQFWDGRAIDLIEQIDGPIHNTIEMGANWPLIISRLELDSDYRRHFNQIFSDGITSVNIKTAIADFERHLVTPNSPFDRYLKGDETALNEAQLLGYERFKNLGCISCHQGINVGGNMYQKIGIIHDYFADKGKVNKEDLGLYNLTGNDEDKHKFKVPSLRNVLLTAPYFHDGSVSTLNEAIRIMAYYQLGENIRESEVIAIEAFLATLTGEFDITRFMQAPK